MARWSVVLTAGWLSLSATSSAQDLDVVLSGGRVLDPETGLDAVRHVGVRDGEIVAVSRARLEERLRPSGVRIDASGLFVVPGFIDLHAHGQSSQANEFQAHDGVTTALELEAGVPFVEEWLASRDGDALIHYGASVSHPALRAVVMPSSDGRRAEIEHAFRSGVDVADSLDALSETAYEDLPEERTEALYELFETGLQEGGLGLGMPHQYYPGASRREIFRLFQFGAEKDIPIFTHVRSADASAIQEVVANAAATGASLHVVHVNSVSLGEIALVLDIIGGAQERGLDVTTEVYPYSAASTGIQSAIFDERWQERLGISYGDIQWQDTGERLTESTFAEYRQQGGVVIVHVMKPEWIDLAVATPFVMIASDGMPYAPGAHPRSAGTFARVLGRYVREREVLGLMEAVGKMTLLPAKRLESLAPVMKKKGRLQVGADADIVVFDLETVIDTATFEDDLSRSKGVEHVLVDGVFVVRDGETVQGVTPGEPILGRYHPASR